MNKYLTSLVIAALMLSGCSSVTSEPVLIKPYEYNFNASQNDLYFASVDCSLDNIGAPLNSGQFFDYQDKDSGRLSVAFKTEYILSGLSVIPLKTTMSIKVSDNKLNIRFSSLQQYFDSVGWTSVYQHKDRTITEPELKLQEVAERISSCVASKI
ncbi:hypothetical protein L5M36_03295 [Shewanella sp. SM72]|uniref:hypothetical protein n=1 Tax=Shewanella sp. SM72 TaxID=2912805 RepID=UPI0021D856EF|nr:hypothetical protein [Shewanella sp. SM72]MCU8015924.1 hypothetical protein [Shewanella sp. SM72]